MVMPLKDFVRPDAVLVEQYRDLAKCCSASCVFADVQRRGGMIVAPSANLAPVLAAAREQAAREEATRQRIREGRTFEQLLEEFGRI